MSKKRGWRRPLRWARNHHVHQLLDMSEWDQLEGLTFPMTSPLRFDQLRWRVRWLPADQIPQPDKQDKNWERGRTTYTALFAGNEVLATLQAAVRWLDRAEPPSARRVARR